MTKEKKSFGDIFFNIIIPVIILIIAVISMIIPITANFSNSNHSKTTQIEINNNSKIVGYALDDLKNITQIEYVNHIPNQYVQPGQFAENSLIEKTSKLTRATTGTIQIILFNYDKNSNNIEEKLLNNKFYNSTTKSSFITLNIPFAYDSATIWVNDTYNSTSGPLTPEYDPSDYVSKENEIRTTILPAEPTKLVCLLPSQFENIPDNRLEGAQIITIHYQARRGVNFNNNLPIAGINTHIINSIMTKYSSCIVSIIAIIALLLTAMALMILKLYIENFPYLGIVFSALLLNIAQLLSLKNSVIAGKALVLFSLALLQLFTILSIKPNKKPSKVLWIIILCLTSANTIIMPFISAFGSIKLVKLYCQITFILIMVLEIVYTIFVAPKASFMEIIGFIIAGLTPPLALFFNFSLVWYINPTCILINASSLVLVAYLIDAVRIIEKKNKNLTDNLVAEVAAQTENLSSAIQDREVLLSFLSHDLRKSSLTIKNLSEEIINDRDRVNSPIAEKIKDKNDIILNSLSDISKYMKHDLSAEPFQVIKLNSLFREIEHELSMDCEAYGIILNCDNPKLSVRAKASSLKSILSNLVFNAIEHAECQNITLTAKTHKDKVQIEIYDDGKGIDSKSDIFSPFVTSNDTDSNLGLGLFLVKTEIESMGGHIEYMYDNGSKFIITLLREY